ncbi:MAG TPA: elongation factor P, partial [Candidatus Wildermuthbacteria bacterium]|nr:elongation factor P [Candidatus Wildermuthbacteria bacterium]
VLEGSPYEVFESSSMFKGRGSSVTQTRMRNLQNGNILQKTFHAGEEVEEAEIVRFQARFIYANKGKFIFSHVDDPSKRFELIEGQIGEQSRFLKENEVVEGLVFKDKVINVSLPIKIQLKVTEAPPGVKGDRAQGGTKTVTLETDTSINVPLFVDVGDIIEVNTDTGEYVRRVQEN